MKFIKSIKKAVLIVSITYITIGVLLILNKQESNKQAMVILAYGLSIAGILSMIRYFLINVEERIKRNDFVVGALLISIAALIYLSKNDITYLVSKIIAVAMIISALYKIQDLFDTKAVGKKCVGIYLFGFMVCLMFGLIVLFDVIENIDVLYVVIGIGMCVCGVSDIVSNFYVAAAFADYGNKSTNEINEVKEEPKQMVAEVVEEENEDVPLQ